MRDGDTGFKRIVARDTYVETTNQRCFGVGEVAGGGFPALVRFCVNYGMIDFADFPNALGFNLADFATFRKFHQAFGEQQTRMCIARLELGEIG